MLLANSFYLWQKDAFFSAAEEVQQSADIMESAYRTWSRKKIGGLEGEDLVELCRELQTALGTTKWQLEEFEKAVSSSYRNQCDDSIVKRHKQFVDAIQDQIFRVEASLRDSFNENNENPIRWVNLDEEDYDDLAAFLSGSSSSPSSDKIEFKKVEDTSNGLIQKDQYCSSSSSVYNKDAQCIIDVEEKIDSTWNLPNTGIADEYDEMKDRGATISMQRFGYSRLRSINWFNQILLRVSGSRRRHRQVKSPLNFHFTSARFMFVLMLLVFFMVPFLLYST
ncbi:uncharacterized protein LOC124935815 [Impatiens glandulifera]|uniref:uncharacterized protein LOC124935815 n=1 Tax=Impatiens glandulifera TaxID=253017 RepID=UPI001FB127C6|nr:uncharacterized protein LOC124935815 [Impatiens glandulifera]